MNKFRAAIIPAVAGLLLVGATSSADAETLYRNGSKKVTITPQSAPAGTVVTSARITVKKGKKTVARNKTSYRAKKGKYKVTSTVSYYTPGYDVQGPATTTIVPITEDDLGFEKCTVTSRSVVNRTVQTVEFYDYDSDYLADSGTIRGQAAITYTGNCTATFWGTSGYESGPIAWSDEWTEVESVYESLDMTRAEYDAFNVQAWLENELAKNSSVLSPDFVGDLVLYPGDGTEMDKAGSLEVTVPGAWQTVPAGPVTTVKTSRTVVVR